MTKAHSITEPVLVINAGSSSLKAKLFPYGHTVLVERIGTNESAIHPSGKATIRKPVASHEEALNWVVSKLLNGVPAPRVVGHRLVHGGTKFFAPLVVTPDLLTELEQLNDLAPLHNPANIEALRAAMSALPDASHVVAFDTAFHATLPPVAYRYAIPNELYEQEHIRRFGFHGTSHDYVSNQAARVLGRPRSELKIITLHLGNGASVAAIKNGLSVDTSMGYTPLEGLVMGTRSGDIDPGVLLHLLRLGWTGKELDTMLNRKSGLLGLSGLSNDMRDLRHAAANGDEASRLAIDVFVYRIRKTIGAYVAVLDGLDALVFTGGIGENDPELRKAVTSGFQYLDMHIHQEANDHGATVISLPHSRVDVLVIQTDEELAIAKQALNAAAGSQ